MAKIDIKYVNIRVAEPKDCKIIAEIEKNTSKEPWSEQSLAEDIAENDKSIVILAEIDGKVIAYADVWKVADELQLNNIAVIEEYRGNHIAKELLEVLADAGREIGCTVMNLEVRESNSSARALYEHAGFHVVGQRENYYLDNNENAILMDLNL